MQVWRFGVLRLAVLASICVAFAACAQPSVAPTAAVKPMPDSHQQTLVTGCEPAKPFSGFRTEIFLADDAQLKALFDCRFLGLTRERTGSVAPGNCSLEEHSSQVMTLPTFSMNTMHHLGEVLNAPVVDRPPWPDHIDWPPLTLEYVGATTAPVGTLWVVPQEYCRLLQNVSRSQESEAVGAALASHLLALGVELRAKEPAGVCTSLIARLGALAVASTKERRKLYVLSRSETR